MFVWVCRIFLLHSMDFPPAGVFPIRSFLCPHHEEEGKAPSWLTLLMFGFRGRSCFAPALLLSGIFFAALRLFPHFPGFLFPLFISRRPSCVLSWFCLALHCSRTCSFGEVLQLEEVNSVVCNFLASHLGLFSPTSTALEPSASGASLPRTPGPPRPLTCYASLTMRWYKKLLAINQLSLFNYLAHFAIYPLLATDTPKKSSIIA